MPRKKSLRDIINQRERLLNTTTGSRRDRVRAAADRYIDNIRSTKSYRRDYDSFWSPLNERERQIGVSDITTSRKYSPRTYMGLSNG